MDWNIGAVYLVAVGFHTIMIAIASYVLFFLKYDDDGGDVDGGDGGGVGDVVDDDDDDDDDNEDYVVSRPSRI